MLRPWACRRNLDFETAEGGLSIRVHMASEGFTTAEGDADVDRYCREKIDRLGEEPSAPT